MQMNKNININEIGMYEPETNLLIKYLNSEDTFFEWGSGGSTYNLCNLVKEYYSVEHDFEWYNKVVSTLKDRNINNVTMLHKPIHDIKFDTELDSEASNLLKLTSNVSKKDNIFYSTTRSGYDWHCHIDYINSIAIPNKKFSKAFVDGRARIFCAYKAYNYLTDDGLLFIHDWSRKRYHTVLDYYSIVEENKDTQLHLVVLKKK